MSDKNRRNNTNRINNPDTKGDVKKTDLESSKTSEGVVKTLSTASVSKDVGSDVKEESNKDNKDNGATKVDTSGMDLSGINSHPTPPSKPLDLSTTFDKSVELAGANEVDKIHTANLISNLTSLFTLKTHGLVSKDFGLVGSRIISVTRSMNLISDKVFIALLPALLDTFEQVDKRDDILFTDSIKIFRIVTVVEANPNITRDHVMFINGLRALSCKSDRAKNASSIDIDHVFPVLSDSKRALIRQILS